MDRRGFVATGIGGLLLMGLGSSTQPKYSQFLRLAFFRSINYVAGVSGFTLNQDGSAEFNNLTIRGSFFGTDFEITPKGAFFYTGTPAPGNLVASIVPGSADVTDNHTNTAHPGICVYGGATQPFLQLFVAGLLPTAVPRVNLKGNIASENTPGALTLDVANSGLVNEFLEMNLYGPSVTQRKDYASIGFQSSAEDLSNGAIGSLNYFDSAGVFHSVLSWDSGGVHANETLFGTGGVLSIGDEVRVINYKFIDAEDPNSAGNAETWHALGGVAGMTGPTRYKLGADARVYFEIRLTSTAGTGAGTYTFANALASNKYYPTTTTPNALLQCTTNGTLAAGSDNRVFVNFGNGQVQLILNNALNAGQLIECHDSYPIDL